MKIRILLFLNVLLMSVNCKTKYNDYDLYEFLNICNDEFYLDLGVNASNKLEAFETFLIQENHLIDRSGKSYKVLLRELVKKTYFDPPLAKDDFNNVLLYKNPKHLYECVGETFQIDSVRLTELHFFEVSEKIANYLSKDKEVAVQGIFEIYANELSEKELEMPYIREIILTMLYRWYFSSKYDRTIHIENK